MPQSLAKILVHTVFSTKGHRPLLKDRALRDELHPSGRVACPRKSADVGMLGGRWAAQPEVGEVNLMQ